MAKINKLIDLIESGQQIYLSKPNELSFQCGKEMSSTWADLLLVAVSYTHLTLPTIYSV